MHAIVLVVVSMVAGGALFALASLVKDAWSTPAPITPVPTEANRLPDAPLPGPDGPRGLRNGRTSIVHVWLQGCADCMPAFEALRDLHARGGLALDAPEINVSYGRSDPAWADRYTVGSNLVWDVGGSAVVKPLGIASFTTLVVDENGYVIHRDRPDRPGYLEAVRRVLVQHGAKSTVAPPRRLGKDDIEPVVDRHTPAMRACWDRNRAGERDVTLSVRLVVDAEGGATQVAVEGGDPELTECVRKDVTTWRFPQPITPTPLTIPVHLTRS
jgi:hypothetical protein